MKSKDTKNTTKVVVFSGGSGGATILYGLKNYFSDLTAIVTMFDSGGSTGRLRDEFGILPPGDVRSCILALSPEDKTELLRSILNFRFSSSGDLNGHNLGNLILTALGALSGGELEGIRALSQLLEIQGTVLPVTLDYSNLYARLENGIILEGESAIDIRPDTDAVIQEVYLEPEASIHKDAQEALRNADVIIFGPGDLYTSIIPSLLVRGVREALKESKARMLYVSNITTKPAETKGYTVSMHAREILRYAGLDSFDDIVANKSSISTPVRDAYAQEGKELVQIDEEASLCASSVVVDDFVTASNLLRHDSDKLARCITSLLS